MFGVEVCKLWWMICHCSWTQFLLTPKMPGVKVHTALSRSENLFRRLSLKFWQCETSLYGKNFQINFDIKNSWNAGPYISPTEQKHLWVNANTLSSAEHIREFNRELFIKFLRKIGQKNCKKLCVLKKFGFSYKVIAWNSGKIKWSIFAGVGNSGKLYNCFGADNWEIQSVELSEQSTLCWLYLGKILEISKQSPKSRLGNCVCQPKKPLKLPVLS